MSEEPTMSIEKQESTIEVLNLSFPRCGTGSLRVALNILGYKTWHSQNLPHDDEACRGWIRALDIKHFGKRPGKLRRTDFDELFGDYTAVSADPPASDFAEELIRLYPDAKAILVERNIESWFQSFDHTLVRTFMGWRYRLIAYLDPGFAGLLYTVYMRTFHGRFKAHSVAEVHAVARDIYRDHYATVRRVCPPDRLLEFQLSQGWEPLCTFLGKPVPDVPFPRVNEAAAMAVNRRRVYVYGVLMLGKWLSPVLLVGLGWWLRGYTSTWLHH